MKELDYAVSRKKPLAPVNLWENGKEQKGPAWVHCNGSISVDFRDIERDCLARNIPFPNHELWNDKVYSLKNLIRTLIANSKTGRPCLPGIQQVDGTAFLADLKNWLNPVDFTNDRDLHARNYVGGTRLWTIRDIVIRLRNENQPVVWP